MAVVILETYDHAAATRGWNPAELETALEWAADHLRSMPRSEFERLWYLSAVALATAAMRVDVLTGDTGDSRFGRGFSLLDEAETRYTEEPRFRLARVVAARPARTVANRPGVRLTTIAGLSGVSAGAAEQHVMDTLRRLDDLAGDEAVGAEARLRAGMIRFHLGEAEQALEDARHAARDEEPFLSYLGHLLAGHVLAHLGRDAEAIQAYEQAVAIESRARSGVAALASRLVAAERHDEAYAVLENYFVADASVDPWLQYGWGDYRLWPSYLFRLRALIASQL